MGLRGRLPPPVALRQFRGAVLMLPLSVAFLLIVVAGAVVLFLIDVNRPPARQRPVRRRL